MLIQFILAVWEGENSGKSRASWVKCKRRKQLMYKMSVYFIDYNDYDIDYDTAVDISITSVSI